MLIIKLDEFKVVIDEETGLPSISILDVPEFTRIIDHKEEFFTNKDILFTKVKYMNDYDHYLIEFRFLVKRKPINKYDAADMLKEEIKENLCPEEYIKYGKYIEDGETSEYKVEWENE